MYRFVSAAFASALLIPLIPSDALARGSHSAGHGGGHGGGRHIGGYVGGHARFAPVGSTVRTFRAGVEPGFRAAHKSGHLTHFRVGTKTWSVTHAGWNRHIVHSPHHHRQLLVGDYGIPYYSFVGSSYDDNCYWLRGTYGWVKSCDYYDY